MRSNKIVGVLCLCLLWAGSAHATYTSAQLATSPEVTADGNIHYIAVFSGPGEQDVKRDVLVLATADIATALKAELQRIAASLNRTRSKDASVPPVNTVVDVQPVVVLPPGPEQAAFFKLFTEYVTMKTYADIGVPAAQEALPAMLEKVIAAFKTEYVTGVVSK